MTKSGGSGRRPKPRAVIGFDSGTGGVTMALYDVDANKIVAFGSGCYEHVAGLKDPRFREQDPEAWVRGMQQAAEDLRSKVDLKAYEIVAIGIGGHMHAAVFLDAEGKVIRNIPNGVMWNDPRGAQEAEELAKRLEQPIPGRLTASRMCFLARHYRQVWREQVATVTVPSAYIGWRLTGVHAVGRGDAAGMWGQLAPDDSVPADTLAIVTQDCGIPKSFPRIVAAGTPIGVLNAEGAQLLGLKPGIPVAPPEGDQPVGMVAGGSLEVGDLSASLGNSVVLNAVGAEPVLGYRGFLDAFLTVVPKRHLLMVCVNNGCSAYDAVVNHYRPLSGFGPIDEIRRQLANLAAAVPAGAHGVTMLPLFGPEGVLLETNPFASITGLRAENFTPGVVMRALYEAETLMMRAGFAKMGLQQPNRIVVSGGGSKDPLWPQIIADVFGAPVMKPQDAAEAASRGAAYLGLFVHEKSRNGKVTLSDVVAPRVDYSAVLHPNRDNFAVYEAKLREFERVLSAMRPLYG